MSASAKPTSLLLILISIALPRDDATAADRVLPGTQPLTIEQPLDEVMVDGINRFCLRELAASRERRKSTWIDGTPQANSEELVKKRDRFRQLIGAVDAELSSKPANGHSFELVSTLEQSSVVAWSENVTVHAVRWKVLDGITAEGLLLKPAEIRAAIVALPEADWTPEALCGITSHPIDATDYVRRLAEAGCLVVIPVLISRDDELSGSPFVTYTNQPHREFIYRQAFEIGRHVIGYEVQKVLAAVDLFEQMSRRNGDDWPIGVAGVSEGGLIALYSAAIDARMDATLVSGYFQQREDIWQEPIYRNVWGLLTEFGDAELAGMIAPRRLVIEACRVPSVKGPPVNRAGRRGSAAPGSIAVASPANVRSEFKRASAVIKRRGVENKSTLIVSGKEGRGAAGSPQAVCVFAESLGLDVDFKLALNPWKVQRTDFAGRQKRQFDAMQDHVQKLLRLSTKVRHRKWKADKSSVEAWTETGAPLRRWVYDELIGRVPLARSRPNPRTRLLRATPEYVAYEVVLDVFPNVIAAGILLLPRDLKNGEERPVVVCQHGLEGTAMDTISREARPWRSYKAFSEELCKRGFIVYAPQNPYRGMHRFRSIQRKSNPLKRTLFSYIIPQHEQTVAWLATLPNVDPNRIAFYGLSYGGKTAMRVPPFVDGYCLSICSGDFTQWVKTITTNEDRYGYIFTGEYEIPEWNMGHVASYAELAILMTPRPFMVEQGHFDGGAPVEWVAGEFGKVRRHYDLLRIGDRAEIEFFNGGHTINGQGTFRFLYRHLNWQGTVLERKPSMTKAQP